MAANKKYIRLVSYEMYYICNGVTHLTHKTQLTCVHVEDADLEKVLTSHILHSQRKYLLSWFDR